MQVYTCQTFRYMTQQKNSWQIREGLDTNTIFKMPPRIKLIQWSGPRVLTATPIYGPMVLNHSIISLMNQNHLTQLQRFGMHTPPSGVCCSFHILPVTLSFSSFLSPPEKKSAMFRCIMRPSWLSLTFRWPSLTLRGVPSHVSFLPFAPTSRL